LNLKRSNLLDADSWIFGGLLVVGFCLAAFAAAAEMALASVSRTQLRQASAPDKARADAAEALLNEPARFLSTLMVLKFVGLALIVGSTTILWQRVSGSGASFWALLSAIVLLITSQLLPRAWTVGRQEQVALWLAPIVRVCTVALTPITAPMRRVGQESVPDGMSAESIFLSEDGLRFLLNVTDEETIIEDDEKEMIASIFEFGETLVREVMVPRIDVMAVPVDTPMLEALDVILKAGHSRIPVYGNTIDNILGILYAKDMLRYLSDGSTDVPLAKFLRPAYFIPESKKVDELLGELQQRKVHMSIVVDEYGGTAGLVTIEDLLEEIVGEIQDEYDAEEPTVEAVSETEFLFDARADLDEVSKLLGVELPEEGGDTLGGFIYSQLGKVPAVGDTIEFGEVKVAVLSVAGRRIKQVRASVNAPSEPSETDTNDRSNGGGLTFLTFLTFR
jgi:putative hemolysin